MSYVKLINIFLYKCRICLEDDGIIDIFTTPMLQTNIELCTNITVAKNDSNPKCICNSCNELILTSVRLRALAADADERLKRILNSEEAVELDLLNDCTPNIEVSDDVYCPLQDPTPDDKPLLPYILVQSNRLKRKKKLIKDELKTPVKKLKHTVTERKTSSELKIEETHNDRSFTFQSDKIKKEESRECQVCGKTFVGRSSMYLHLRIHDEIKKNKCPDCPKSFCTKSDLRKHHRVHTGERPYECSICSKTFAQNVTLKAHKMNIHKESN